MRNIHGDDHSELVCKVCDQSGLGLDTSS